MRALACPPTSLCGLQPVSSVRGWVLLRCALRRNHKARLADVFSVSASLTRVLFRICVFDPARFDRRFFRDRFS